MCWDSVAVTSIKSRDLNTKTLQNPTKLEYIIRKDIDSVAQFQGKQFNGTRIYAYDIKSRVLEVATPNLGTKQQQDILSNMIEHGKIQGVEVKIIIYSE